MLRPGELLRRGPALLSRAGRELRERVAAGKPENPAALIDSRVEELSYFRGHVHVRGSARTTRPVIAAHLLDGAGQRLAAATVASAAAEGGDLGWTFDVGAQLPDPRVAAGVVVRLRFDDRTFALVRDGVARAAGQDPYHLLERRFFDEIRRRGAETGGSVLEIGARARSGHTRQKLVEPMTHVGLDIVPGEGADVVGDAHSMSALFEPATFDAAFSISTFEHLVMPWKAAIELNRVLKPGALVLIASHQSFPLHEQPWDFWRFSASGWGALFNAATGYRIVDTAMGEPAAIVARLLHAVTITIDEQPAFIASSVLAEKVGDTDLRWDVPTDVAARGSYPA